jgi:hypothetical protein
MRRAIVSLIVPAVVLMLATTAFSLNRSVVLGWKRAFRNGQGFGATKPRTVYLGGDPTGYVSKLRWYRWGSRKAVGYGQGWCAGPSGVAAGHYCKASLRVSDLGFCRGRRAYRVMAFAFKPDPRKRWEAGAKLNVCTGQYLS